MKRRTKARIIWFSTLILAAAFAAVMLFPAVSDFSFLKGGLVSAMSQHSGMTVQMDGPVKITLLPRPTLRAHNVRVKTERFDASAESVQFPIRISDIRNPLNITVPSAVSVRGAKIDFGGKWAAESIDGKLSLKDGGFAGSFFHNGRRFTADIKDGRALIENSAFSMAAEFDYKFAGGKFEALGKFKGSFPDAEEFINGFGYSFGEVAARPWGINADFVWDGKTLNLGNMTLSSTDTILKGSAKIPASGAARLDLQMIEGDLSILETPGLSSKILNMSGAGRFRRGDRIIKKFALSAAPTGERTEITRAEFAGDDFQLRAKGFLKDSVADNMSVSLYQKDGSDLIGMNRPVSIRCDLSGDISEQLWECKNFLLNMEKVQIGGEIEMSPAAFRARIGKMSGMDKSVLIKKIEKEAGRDIDIRWPESGEFYTFIRGDGTRLLKSVNSRLEDIPFALPLLGKIPAELKQKLRGEVYAEKRENVQAVSVKNKDIDFAIIDDSGSIRWTLNGEDLAGTFAQAFPGFDTAFMKDGIKFEFSGEYRRGKFENLKLSTTNGTFRQTFRGWGEDGAFKWTTEEFNIDTLLSQKWIKDYEQLQFLHQMPIISLFRIPFDFSLTADKAVAFDNQEFKRLVYSRAGHTQKISVENTAGGNGIAEISRVGGADFEISIKASRWKIPGKLSLRPGLNIMDTTASGEILLTTFGLTANDITENIEGSADLAFEGGAIVGMNANAIRNAAINRGNLDEFLGRAFAPEAKMEIRTLSIPVRISGAEVISSAPFNLKSDSANAAGEISAMTDGVGAKMWVSFKNAAPETRPLEITVSPAGGVKFDGTEALRSIDPDYIRAGIK
ncbi:MAG: AsmA family protein [Rickettsiales bacterium]|jgi:hypothetical protein|nr:AsmA family protein [Rickettsiales bacterium]